MSLHAANVNSQRTVFRINMPPSFLLWRIEKKGTVCPEPKKTGVRCLEPSQLFF